MSLPHYDARISPTCTLVIQGPLMFVGADGDLTAPAHILLRDLRALRAALNRWEDELLAQQVAKPDPLPSLTLPADYDQWRQRNYQPPEDVQRFWRGDGWRRGIWGD